ncbi:RES domain-containing protein [Streptomyces sp. S465]|uniref:RES domain-containing protein n=1 Tax=Streptomyces sp. S465 TaxID=2979468 RepID=UPI0022A83E40|nr:RES domain-containing protein [Streptomyces sp. S465]WAP55050.1 RES domain-containing protein [Streptomyces sp. S465]
MSVLRPPSQPLVGEAFRIPEGTSLHRVHYERRGPTAFNPVVENSHFFGERFDGTPADPYPFLYAAFTPETALAETVLHAVPFDEGGARLISPKIISGRRLAELKTTEPLDLLDLTSAAALARVGQSSWLVLADSGEYRHTRAWAALLREHNPWAQGFVWPSFCSHPEHMVVLFGDRCPSNILVEVKSAPLNPTRANDLLRAFRAQIPHQDPPGPLDEALPISEPPQPAKEKEGDDFVSFFKAHFPQVCRILNARQNDWELAQDAASRAFQIAHRRWPDVRAHPNRVGWVVKTGRRILMRVHRIQAKHPEQHLGDTDLNVSCEDLDPATTTVEKVALRAAIRNLARDKRECFVMHYVLHYSVADIAEFVQIPPGTVKSRLSAARRDLRDALGHDFREGGTR